MNIVNTRTNVTRTEDARLAVFDELMIKHRGRDHKAIETEMRSRGWPTFSRRILYPRTQGRGQRPGWIVERGWDKVDWRASTPACLAADGVGTDVDLSLKGTQIIAQGKAVGRHPGIGVNVDTDPERVEQSRHRVAPLQGADGLADVPGVPPKRLHPRLLSSSPSATEKASTRSSGAQAAGVNPPSGLSDGNLDIGPSVEAAESGNLCSRHAAMASGGGSDDWMAEMSSPEDPDFQAWLKRVSPDMTWDWKHQLYIYERLKRVTSGECKRLMVFMPPRHGKSELLTIHYTAFRMRHKPQMKVIVASYAQTLANKFSRGIRRVLSNDAALAQPAQSVVQNGSCPQKAAASNRETASALPEPTQGPCPRCRGEGVITMVPRVAAQQSMFPFVSDRPANSISDWGTAAGGGLRAVGVGSGVTGYGADLIMIDDPVKSRAQAESSVYRERLWEWYNDDIYTRLESGGAIILTQSRWHEDDLAGRLLKQMAEGGDEWEIIDLPALAEESATGRQGEGETDWTASVPACQAANAADDDELDTDHTDETDKTDRANSKESCDSETSLAVPSVPSVLSVPSSFDPLGREPGEALCPERYDEKRLTDIRSQLGSYSYSALFQQRPTPAEGAIFKREWFTNIIDAAPPGLRWFRGYDLAISTRTTADYTASFRVAFDENGFLYIADGFRKRVEYPEQRRYIIERIRRERNTLHGIEDSGHGKAIMQELRRELRLMHHAFRLVPVSNDKVTRALTWSPIAEDGKVKLVRGGWIEDLITELASFPNSTHDDQTDAISIAVKMLAEANNRKVVFF